MKTRRRVFAGCVFALGTAVAQSSGNAQILERIKQGAKSSTDAATDAAKKESHLQFDAAVRDLAATPVADGGFIAVASPWSSSDSTKRTDIARFSGTAMAIGSGASYTIVLCDPSSSRRWTGSLAVLPKPAPSSSLASESEYTLPDKLVTATVGGQGVTTGLPTSGSLRIATVAQKSVVGVARLKFAQARLPGTTAPEAVDVGISFKALIQNDARAIAAGCNSSLAGVNQAGGPAGASSKGIATGTSAGEAVQRSAPEPTTGRVLPAGAGPSFAQGDVLIPKIEGVKLLSDAQDGAPAAATLKKTDELVYLGDERNGFVHVQGAAAEGWVKKVLVAKR